MYDRKQIPVLAPIKPGAIALQVNLFEQLAISIPDVHHPVLAGD
jgi:hypothetical protein